MTHNNFQDQADVPKTDTAKHKHKLQTRLDNTMQHLYSKEKAQLARQQLAVSCVICVHMQ